ncbi:MAG TPA: sulfotransferase [Candidatus Methylomirabilis sp.]|nr:sulfotransferase [Candidatus Methylomirabilis sp.]
MRRSLLSLRARGWHVALSLDLMRVSVPRSEAGKLQSIGAMRCALGRRAEAAAREHIVHIGYHKTASTWLQVCVFPYCAGVRYGDPLCNDFVTNLATAPERAFFAEGFRRVLRQIESQSSGPLLLSNEGLSGSLWDGDEIGLRNAARLHRVIPAGRIMIVVRRQDEMLRSIHAQYVNEGGTRPLREFVGRSVEGSRFSLRHLEYDRLIGRYVELFGRDRVWVVPYEHLRAGRERFLDALCAFLGAELTAEVSRAWPNHSLSRPSLWLLRSWNRLFRVTRFNRAPGLAALPGGKYVRNLMQERVDPVVRRLLNTKDSVMDSRWLADLAAGFAESNSRLQRFCAQPLATWGYPLLPATTWTGARPDSALLDPGRSGFRHG